MDGVTGHPESLPEPVDPVALESISSNKAVDISDNAKREIKSYYQRCSPGEILSALLLEILLSGESDKDFGNEILADLEERIIREDMDVDPDGPYLAGLIQGLTLASQ